MRQYKQKTKKVFAFFREQHDSRLPLIFKLLKLEGFKIVALNRDLTTNSHDEFLPDIIASHPLYGTTAVEFSVTKNKKPNIFVRLDKLVKHQMQDAILYRFFLHTDEIYKIKASKVKKLMIMAKQEEKLPPSRRKVLGPFVRFALNHYREPLVIIEKIFAEYVCPISKLERIVRNV